MKVPISRPVFGRKEESAAARAIRSGHVVQGPEVEAFETAFGEYVGAAHSVAVSSGSAALFLALKAIGAGPGTEVITASHSFISTANAVRLTGAVPVFADVEPDTYNMNPDRAQDLMTEKTKAILCVHQIGMPCDLNRILALADANSIPVVEDAACAAGSEILVDGKWDRIGKPHGELACFSFHPRKILSTGEGGMITTNNGDLTRWLRKARTHGASHDGFGFLGYNFRMTDIQGAVGKEQIKRLPWIIARRRELAKTYDNELSRIEGLITPREPDWAKSNWQSYCIRLPENLSQDKVMEKLRENGIASQKGIMCAHREPIYHSEPWSCGEGPGDCGCVKGACRNLAESEKARDRCLLIPLYPQMTDRDQGQVIRVIQKACSP